MDNENIKKKAEDFARAHKRCLAEEITDIAKFVPDLTPISIFMAGSPGAGKTEYSKSLISLLEKDKRRQVIRIDGDELRQHFPDYTGDNSYLFQGAISILVEKIHDLVLLNKQTFIFDGTLSKYNKAVQNIQRSLDKKRSVIIFYVYQKPEVAWKFTIAREKLEGRNIPKEVFIQHFLDSQKTINAISSHFGDKVTIFLVKKNFETHAVEDIVEIKTEKNGIEFYLEKSYNETDLDKLL